MKLLNEVIGARFPDDTFDLLFGVGAQVFPEAAPVKTCETAPQVTPHPVFCWLDLPSADNAGVGF